MKISVRWLTPGRNASPELAETICQLRVSIGGKLATEHRRAKQIKLTPYVALPAYVVAEGIAERWWRILAGRGRITRFRSFRSGFALPDIQIFPSGKEVSVRCDPFSYDNPPMDFINGSQEWIPLENLAREFTDLIERVLEQLTEAGIEQSDLSTRWTRIKASFSDARERAFCEAAGALDVDPYAIDDTSARLIEDSATVFTGESVQEFLAGVRPDSGLAAIEWLRHAEAELSVRATLPEMAPLHQKIAQQTHVDPRPWVRGYETARKVREELKLEPESPVGDISALARRLGNNDFDISSESARGLRAVVSISQHDSRIIVGGGVHPSSSLFALARAIGDGAYFGFSGRSPVTDQENTYRQALGRAFAAEFLAPAEPVFRMHLEGYPPEDIAQRFGVSDHVIVRQIENQPRIPSN